MKKKTVVWIIVTFFLILGAAAAGSFFLIGIVQPPVRVASGSLLQIGLGGTIEETIPADPIYSYLFGSRALSMHDLWSNLRKAKADPRIEAVLLRLNFLDCDWAKIEEIRQAVLDFRSSGKKAFAYIEEAPDFDKEYYLATACDRIVLHPLGWLGVNGIGGYVPFFKNALDKLGIKAEFEHVEEYKTAYNTFTEKGFTPAHREETESIMTDRFNAYVAGVAKARKMTEARFRELIDTAFFQGEAAVKAGLVDECLYEDELQLMISGKGKPMSRVGFQDYSRVSPSSVGLETGRRIALVYATGTIMQGEGFYKVLGGSTMARWLRQVRQDKSVKAVVLRIDSPGGSSVASDVIWREVELTRREKPVIVSMSDLAGSGGYWIAMPATKIVAQPQTLTGSIGVLAGKFSMSGLLEKLGVTTEKLTFGERSAIFSILSPFTPEEKKVLKSEIVWTYGKFLDKAAEGRHMTREAVDKVGKGRVWTGRQAKEIGLIDELGGLTEAITLAKKEAGIPASEEVKLDVWPKKQSIWRRLLETGDLGAGMKSPLLRRVERSMDIIENMGRVRAWALMPLEFDLGGPAVQ